MDNSVLIDNKLVELVRQGNKLFFFPNCDTSCQWIFERYEGKSNYFVVLSSFFTKDHQDSFWQELSDNLNRLGEKELDHFKRWVEQQPHRYRWFDNEYRPIEDELSQKKVLLIASSGNAHLFKVRNIWGFLFFQPPSEILQKFKNNGVRINCFVSNYHSQDLLDEVLSVSADNEMTYLTSYSPFTPGEKTMGFYPPEDEHKLYHYYIYLNKQFQQVKHFGVRKNADDRNCLMLRKYKVRTHFPEVYEWKNNHLCVTLEYDSIGNHLKELDGAIISRKSELVLNILHNRNMVIKHPEIVTPPVPYFTRTIWDHWHKPFRLSWGAGESLLYLLQVCEQKQWNIVGTIAFGREDSELEMMNILNTWQGDYPKFIRIFYIHTDDFNGIKNQFHLKFS